MQARIGDIDPDDEAETLKLVKNMEAFILASKSTDRMRVSELLISELWAFWEQRLNLLALEVCIEAESELLELRPADHPYRLEWCSYLAVSLWTLYTHNGGSALLDRSIPLEREALDLHSPRRAIASPSPSRHASSKRERLHRCRK